MKYTRFEELPVWKAAIEFAVKAFEFTGKADFRSVGDVKNQFERAVVKNTEIKGEKFLTDKERRLYRQKKDYEEFNLEIKQYRAELKLREEEAARQREEES